MRNNPGYMVVVMMLGAASAEAADAAAQLDWSRRVELGTLVSGMIVDIRVASGSEVALGQVLLRLDQKTFKENLDFAKAEHESAHLELDEASREMQRAQELYDRTVLSNRELETARIAEAKAKTAYAQAKARLAKAESDWRYSEIRSPFDGMIIKVMAEVGQSVVSDMQSTPLMVLVDKRRMLAKAIIGDDQLPSVEIGKKIGIVAGGREYRGEVTAVSFEPVSLKGDKPQYELVVAFEPKDANLRAGQKATIKLP